MNSFDFLNEQKNIVHEIVNKPSSSIGVTKLSESYAGETLDIPLKDLVENLKRNLKFKLTVFTYMANAVGVGFFNTADKSTPTGRQALETINDFAEDWDLDTLN